MALKRQTVILVFKNNDKRLQRIEKLKYFAKNGQNSKID